MKGVNNCSVEDRAGRPFVVSIEGNIGSGKTTFLEHFNKHNKVEVVTEPVEEWRNVGEQRPPCGRLFLSVVDLHVKLPQPPECSTLNENTCLLSLG